ncbi:carbohydrate ABC transporter permease [Eisenbergiella tayi]|uniref:L-arabinose transport system permease protein AraP n=1 Tax=Eisenbergiella tayi TaxID=1432052 RepID=A0A1E3ARF0_9FIRM|nr:sugar ABC transporter permease [Eisenbergiella tayi]ODM11289.1 L-arabinose transport system permease protein AraP [Eisenbergiella tayi]
MKQKTDKQNKQLSMKTRRKILPFLFVTPHLIIFLIFSLIPIIYGLYISFTKWNFLGTPEWVGLANYKEILFSTESTYYRQFMNGLKNTFLAVVLNVPPSIIVPLVLALALNVKVRGSKFFQSVFYLPCLLSLSAVSIIWIQILNKRFGVPSVFGINSALTVEQPWAWLMIVLMSTWWAIGTNMVIYQAALGGVPKELYESASIDGAGSIKRFFYITVPSIRFQILYTIVMTTIAGFNIYGQPLMLTEGGPNGSTTVLIMEIRKLAFGTGQPIAGMASAMAICLGVVILIISAFQFFAMNRKEN